MIPPGSCLHPPPCYEVLDTPCRCVNLKQLFTIIVSKLTRLNSNKNILGIHARDAAIAAAVLALIGSRIRTALGKVTL